MKIIYFLLHQFVSLKSGDEKKRLVPVLQTMLQLSPDEAEALLLLASGQS